MQFVAFSRLSHRDNRGCRMRSTAGGCRSDRCSVQAESLQVCDVNAKPTVFRRLLRAEIS